MHLVACIVLLLLLKILSRSLRGSTSPALLVHHRARPESNNDPNARFLTTVCGDSHSRTLDELTKRARVHKGFSADGEWAWRRLSIGDV
ncbi:hypothetical protein DPEC_G00315010 [Dallia pectoralis]|uniref:Uncharacterized protein n=1 Tax=Dallia pectoralis TaxID=75939 RepID=A0ACC2FCJ5_DALPE|nr:hypothetical protein DPEC_G00315010 [Dallia pectoralis]